MADTTFWPNYLFFTDFSADAASLSAVPVGELSESDATLLAASLSSHDTGAARALWNANEGEPYSLLGAKVVFNGDNHTNLPSNALFKQALIVELPWVDGVHNLLVVQYNLPRQ
jgi:hypothetical protein